MLKDGSVSPVLTVHPLAEIFPVMTAEEFEALKADIAAYGLLEPIVLYARARFSTAGTGRRRVTSWKSIRIGSNTTATIRSVSCSRKT